MYICPQNYKISDMKQNYLMQKVIALALTIAALMVGQTAWAASSRASIFIKVNKKVAIQ